jgi:hypothetical protein
VSVLRSASSEGDSHGDSATSSEASA